MNTRIATLTQPLAGPRQASPIGSLRSWVLARAGSARDWFRSLRWATELVQDPFGPRPD